MYGSEQTLTHALLGAVGRKLDGEEARVAYLRTRKEGNIRIVGIVSELRANINIASAPCTLTVSTASCPTLCLKNKFDDLARLGQVPVALLDLFSRGIVSKPLYHRYCSAVQCSAVQRGAAALCQHVSVYLHGFRGRPSNCIHFVPRHKSCSCYISCKYA